MATIDLMDRFGNLGSGGIRNNGTLDDEVLFQSSLRTMRTDFIQVKAGDSIVYKNMNGMSSSWNILSFYTGEAQGYYTSGIAGQTTPQSGVWTAQQDGYIRLFGSFPAGDKISVTMTDLAPDVEDYLAQYNAMNYRFLPNSIPKIVAHIQEYLSNHPIADSTTLQAVIDAAFQSYLDEIQQTADTYIAEAVPPAAAAAVDAAASPALQEITAKAAEAVESARQAGLSQQSAEMSEENALTYRNQAQQIKDSITAEVSASVLAAQEQATLAQESAQAADESADSAEQYVAQARTQAAAAAAQAQTASGYASDARGYMQDASGFAQNASDFADNAAQSAATFSTDPTLTISGKAADAKATGDGLSALKSAVNKIEDVVLAQAEGITKTNGRYINRSGVQGTAAWCNLYRYTPKNGEIVLINTYAPLNAVPGFYYNGVAYPDSSQSAGEYSGSIVGDGTSILYVNSAVNDVEIKVPDILIDVHAKSEEMQEVSATVNTLQVIGIKERTPVEVSSYEGRYITSEGVQGTLSNYTLKVLTTEPNAVYLIYSEIGTNVAAYGTPIFLFNGVNYTNTTGKGYYIIIGDGEKAYINSLTTANVITDKYVFTSNIKAVPNVFRMFDNIVCCGDSLTYSQVWLSSNSQRQALVTYPEALAKITGTDTETLAVPGYTCKQWWDAFNTQITGANKLYLIYLGTNEPDRNLPNTADTDCAGDDLTQYATNGTGYYGRIIRKILDTGSRCILIKIALGTTGNNKNASISGLATRFSVPVINNPQYMLNDMFYHYGDTTDYYNTIHLNDAGYEAFAELVVDRVNNLTLEEKYALMPKTVT